MPETESHAEQLTYLHGDATLLLSPVDRLHVGGSTFLYYDIDDPNHNVCPDFYVAFGVGRGRRECWLAFEEGLFPQLVIEVVSTTTRKVDLGRKIGLYAEQGVQEYYVCDPRTEVRPRRRLHAFELIDGVLAPRAFAADQGVYSRLLGTELRLVDHFLRIIDPRSGRPFPTLEEEHLARQQAEAAREVAERARLAAERHGAADRQARAEAEAARAEAEERARATEQALQAALARLAERD